MQRREFLKDTGMIAISLGMFGKVSWNGTSYIADTETTTDILGPFYRPNSPIRTNIHSKGYTGKLFHISGTVFKEDGETPFKNCTVEVWQCDEHGIYDNTSDEYNYRGMQKTDADGKYHFIGMHPIPYPIMADKSIFRPAHIHLLVSGEGQQDLITQVYLEGDPHLEKDMGSMSSTAQKRILKIYKNNKNEETVQFDIIMAKEFKPADAVFEKLTGIYKMSDDSNMEFYRQDDFLFLKWNSQIWEGLSYTGNNTFTGGIEKNTVANFQMLTNGDVNLSIKLKSIVKGNLNLEGTKVFKY